MGQDTTFPGLKHIPSQKHFWVDDFLFSKGGICYSSLRSRCLVQFLPIFPQNKKQYICWVWPPHSNSDHQDYETFLVGDPYKPSFTTVTVRGPYPIYMLKHRTKANSPFQPRRHFLFLTVIKCPESVLSKPWGSCGASCWTSTKRRSHWPPLLGCRWKGSAGINGDRINGLVITYL